MTQVLLNGVSVSSLYALAAVGLTLIFGTLRVIQFAHGEMAVLGAYLSLFAISTLGLAPVLGVPMAIALVMAVALVTFELVIRRVQKAPHLNQIVATLGVALAIEGALVLGFGSDPKALTNSFTQAVVPLGDGRLAAPRAVGLLVAAVLMVGLGLVLARTEFGRQVRAVSQDPQVAELMGIDTVSIQRIVFLVGSAFSAVAGLFLAMSAYVVPTSGLQLTLIAFAIVIVGGIGSTTGALIGALLFGFGEALVGAYVPGGTGWIVAVPFVIILVATAVRPKGLKYAV